MDSWVSVCASPAGSGPGRPAQVTAAHSPRPLTPRLPPNFNALRIDDHQTEASHSSEEELEAFNCGEREKRKWSQVNSRTSRDSSCCSSDDEPVTSRSPLSSPGPAHPPVRFRTSPPAHAHKPGGRGAPPSAPPAAESPAVGAGAGAGRKRHRGLQTGPGRRRDTVRPRPCLDFEKMQQESARSATLWRPSAELALFCW